MNCARWDLCGGHRVTGILPRSWTQSGQSRQRVMEPFCLAFVTRNEADYVERGVAVLNTWRS